MAKMAFENEITRDAIKELDLTLSEIKDSSPFGHLRLFFFLGGGHAGSSVESQSCTGRA